MLHVRKSKVLIGMGEGGGTRLPHSEFSGSAPGNGLSHLKKSWLVYMGVFLTVFVV